MKSEFCEKQYEIFLNHELISMGYDIYIPSQRQEKKTGYDALIKPNENFKGLMLQYKIPGNGLIHSTYFSNKSKIFRFNVYKYNNEFAQHNLLVKQNLFGIKAAYCVPLFDTNKDLYNNLRNGTVVNSSVGIVPYKYLKDGKVSHHIEYTSDRAFLFSDNGEDNECKNLIELLESSEIYTGEVFTRKLINIFSEIYYNNDRNYYDLNSILFKNKLALLIKKV